MFNEEIVKPENLVYKKTDVLTDVVMHYCPGCPHGTIHRIIAEVIEEMGIQDKAIGIAPVGCSVLAYNYFNVDFVENTTLSLIKVMETWLQSVQQKLFTLVTAEKTS